MTVHKCCCCNLVLIFFLPLSSSTQAWSQSSFLLAQNVTATSTFPKGDAARHLMADGGAPSVSCVGQSSVSQEGQMQFSGECTSTQSTMLESNDYQSIYEAGKDRDPTNVCVQLHPLKINIII